MMDVSTDASVELIMTSVQESPLDELLPCIYSPLELGCLAPPPSQGDSRRNT